MLRQFRLSLCLLLLIFVSRCPVGAQNPPAPAPLDQQINSQLAQLAGRVLKHANEAACHKNSCTILVANFVDRSGNTSTLGMQLADAFSDQLALQPVRIRIVDRARLQKFLEQERIPPKLLDDRASSWLASTLSASAVLVGRVEEERTGVHLRVRLLNANDAANQQEEIGVDQTIHGIQDAYRFLAPTEPFGDVPKFETTPQGEKIFRAGINGTSMPSCYFHPDPNYSNEARSAKAEGNIVVEMTIRLDESVEDIRILRGVPFGLNDEARKTVAAWKCKPSSLNGISVPTRAQVELTFRLFGK